MAFVNFATREITAKVVYYGPGLGGKTTSLQFIHNDLPAENRGKMISLATEEDRTIYFDFLPLHLGKIQDFAVRVQLYTVPGQVRYNATRKLVLRGADGLVFVADSQRQRKLANVESFTNLEENLREHGKELRDLPHVLQFNKIDLPMIMPADELNRLLNKNNVPSFETCATSGIGILEALKSITKLVFNDLGQKALLQKKARATPTPAPYSVETTLAGASGGASAKYYPPAGFTPELPNNKSNYNELEIEEPNIENQHLSSLEPDYDESISNELQEIEPEMPQKEPPVEDQDESSAKLLEPDDEPGSYSFSYRGLFDDPAMFPDIIERLERQIAGNEFSGAIKTARTIYSHLMTNFYPKDYAREANESLQIYALNLNFKHYLRFKQLLETERLQPSDLLFVHHFLCDLYLALKAF